MSEITPVAAHEGGIGYAPTQIFSARKIAELALGVVGEFSINDEAASPYAMERTLDHMELIIGELAGVDLNWWLIPQTIRFPWPANVRSDTIARVLADDYPSLGIASPISAYVLNTDGVVLRELPLVRRHVYDALENRDTTGQPELLYFDRLAVSPTVAIYRVPDNDDYQVSLTVQTYSRSVLGTQGQKNQAGELPHGFAAEWQSFLVFKTASRIGNGPVRRCPLPDVNKWEETADIILARLQAGSNREKKSQPSRTKRWGS